MQERLDFSCAMFGPNGGLVANAPHIPVHLGAMQEAVQYQVGIISYSFSKISVAYLLCVTSTKVWTVSQFIYLVSFIDVILTEMCATRLEKTTKTKGKGKGSWICIVPHCEKLASEALRHGSHSFLCYNYTTTAFTS